MATMKPIMIDVRSVTEAVETVVSRRNKGESLGSAMTLVNDAIRTETLDLTSELEYAIGRLLDGKCGCTPVEKPDVVLTGTDGHTKFKLIALDRNESYCYDGKHYFGDDHTAGLVYVTEDGNSCQSTEYNLHKPEVWQWVQKHMQAGLDAHTAKTLVRRLLSELPSNKDWLDPELETALKNWSKEDES